MRTYYKSLKSLLVMLVLCMVGTLSAWADSYTYTAKLADFQKSSSFSFTDGDVTWSATEEGLTNGLSSQDKGSTVQIGSSKSTLPSTLTLSTSSIKGSITSIIVETCLSGSNASFSLTSTVGGVNIGEQTVTSNSINTYTFTPSSSAEGEVVIKWENIGTKKTGIKIKSITINYTTSSDPTMVVAPVFSADSKSFSDKFDLTLTKGTNAEMILYTTDGTEPSYEKAVGEEYTAPISITHTTTVKAIAVSNEGKESEVVSKTYTLALPAPELSVNTKNFTEAFDVTVSTTATAAEGILYTLDGTTPSWENNSTEIYEDAINISATTTLKAVSYTQNGSDYEYSPVATATYTLSEPSSVIWSEDFSSFKADDVPTEGENATYECVNGAKLTKIYEGNVAGGTSPELLINKKGGSFSATINDLKGCQNGVLLTFKTNREENGNFIVTIDKATQLSMDITNNDNDYIYTYVFALNEETTSLVVKFNNTTGDNYRIDDIELSKYENISSFNITEAGYATYYTSDAYAMPTGVTGYTITDNNGSELTMKEAYTEGAVVPAQTALVLKGEAGKYSYLPTTSDETAPAENKLHGSDEATETHVEGTNIKYYKLSYDNNNANLGFYWGAADGAAFTNAAHKAYLALEGTTLLSQKRGFSFNELMNGITTSISQANAANVAKQSIFDINGRRVNSLNGAAKGIYIVNGQKVLVK